MQISTAINGRKKRKRRHTSLSYHSIMYVPFFFEAKSCMFPHRKDPPLKSTPLCCLHPYQLSSYVPALSLSCWFCLPIEETLTCYQLPHCLNITWIFEIFFFACTDVVRPCLDVLQKKNCDEILLIWSTKWSLFTKFFVQMGCKSRDESNDAN